MAHDLDTDVAASVEAELRSDAAPLILREMSEEGRAELVTYVINKMEALGIDPRAEYEDVNDDDDDDDFDDEDDCDDDFDDDDNDDRWPGDTDDDEE